MAQIADRGPAWFRSFGTADEPGPRLASVSGAVHAPGVVETAAGVGVGDVISAAGGADRSLGGVGLGLAERRPASLAEADRAVWSRAGLDAYGFRLVRGRSMSRRRTNVPSSTSARSSTGPPASPPASAGPACSAYRWRPRTSALLGRRMTWTGRLPSTSGAAGAATGTWRLSVPGRGRRVCPQLPSRVWRRGRRASRRRLLCDVAEEGPCRHRLHPGRPGPGGRPDRLHRPRHLREPAHRRGHPGRMELPGRGTPRTSTPSSSTSPSGSAPRVPWPGPHGAD